MGMIDSLAQMRSERDKFIAVYMQFVNNRKYYDSHVFCFYEGEDGKYYDPRIRNLFGEKMYTYRVKNKKGVLALLDKIRNANMYNHVCMMFFVDRDFDESLQGTDEDLYETPCYAIENLYACEECMKKILQSEFGLNSIDDDYKKCMNCYKTREKEFDNIILEFNALLCLNKSVSNHSVSFQSIETSQLADISLESVGHAHKYSDVINLIKKKLEVNDEAVEDMKNRLMDKGNYSMEFRGKNQLDFFVIFVMKLKEANNNGTFFDFKHNCVHIHLDKNRLSQLSQYAVTPKGLIDFFGKHKEKFEKRFNQQSFD